MTQLWKKVVGKKVLVKMTDFGDIVIQGCKLSPLDWHI